MCLLLSPVCFFGSLQFIVCCCPVHSPCYSAPIRTGPTWPEIQRWSNCLLWLLPASPLLGIYTALHSCTSFIFFHWSFRPKWPVYVNFTLLAIFSSSLSLNEDKEEVRELLACYAGISDASAPNSDTKSWMILVYQYNSVEHNYVLFK